MDFRKVNYENVGKKNIHFTTNISIYIPTLGNEKEKQQIKFYEKSMSELIFLWATKSLKMIISLIRLGEYSKIKVTPLFLLHTI